MKTISLIIFTRTPLHVGAGASVGAIDQPIQRERHTGFPIIPGSSLKGSLSNHWNDTLLCGKRVDNKTISEAAWLFGSDDSENSFAGALSFTEARVLAFPIRSAKGSFAWITSPMILKRAKRDGIIQSSIDDKSLSDNLAIYQKNGPLDLLSKIVLEDYCFDHHDSYPEELAKELAKLLPDDKLFKTIVDRLVIVSDGMMSYFVTTTCDVAQHVKISDETGTAEDHGLFNQENVPSETLFYALVNAKGRKISNEERTDDSALSVFTNKIKEPEKVFQFGADASTGLGYCSIQIKD
jgi:CRISPR-associated protein Cmr4